MAYASGAAGVHRLVAPASPDRDGSASVDVGADAGAAGAATSLSAPSTGAPAASVTVTSVTEPPTTVASSGVAGETSVAPSATERVTTAGSAGAALVPGAPLLPPDASGPHPARATRTPAVPSASTARRWDVDDTEFPLTPLPAQRNATGGVPSVHPGTDIPLSPRTRHPGSPRVTGRVYLSLGRW